MRRQRILVALFALRLRWYPLGWCPLRSCTYALPQSNDACNPRLLLGTSFLRVQFGPVTSASARATETARAVALEISVERKKGPERRRPGGAPIAFPKPRMAQ